MGRLRSDELPESQLMYLKKLEKGPKSFSVGNSSLFVLCDLGFVRKGRLIDSHREYQITKEGLKYLESLLK